MSDNVTVIGPEGPDWSTAPADAQWAAVDGPDGSGLSRMYWFSAKPTLGPFELWVRQEGYIKSRYKTVRLVGVQWAEALWERPTKPDNTPTIGPEGPDWSTAPAGAQWASVDGPDPRDGLETLWWYTHRPVHSRKRRAWVSSGEGSPILEGTRTVRLIGVKWTHAMWERPATHDLMPPGEQKAGRTIALPDTLASGVLRDVPNQDAAVCVVDRVAHWRDLVRQYTEAKAVADDHDAGAWEDIAELEEQMAQLVVQLFG